MIPIVTMLVGLALPPQDSVNRFRLSVASGVISGTEEYRIERTAQGWRLSGTSRVQRPNGTLDISQLETLTSAWILEGYRLDVTPPGGGQQVIEAWRTGDSVQIRASAGPRSQSRQLALRPRALVLDNLIVSHFQILIDLHTATPAAERVLDWQFIVPQVVTAVRGTVTTADGPAGLRKFSIDVAGTLVEVWAEAATNRLMRVSVPLRQVEMVREGFAMPAPPAAPSGAAPFSERALTFPSDGLNFPATLCLPASREGRVPVVVLVHGSGPHDRDETIGPNKPFRDIAHALAAQGIATLRYDKRTFAFRGHGDWRSLTVDQEVIDDARAAVRYARTLPEIDPTRVFLLGHSLGGTLAPLIAQRLGPDTLAGVILLAPGARPLDEAIVTQVTFRMRLGGQPKDVITREVDQLQAAFARVRAGAAADTEVVFGAPARYWRDFWARRPLDALRQSPLPVLVLQGGHDYQVTKADYDLVQQALTGKPETARESHWFTDLNHLFIQVDGESTGAEYGREGHVDPRVTDAIAAWIGQQRR